MYNKPKIHHISFSLRFFLNVARINFLLFFTAFALNFGEYILRLFSM